MLEIGRLCVKTAGRDAGLKCVVVDDLGKGLVLIDGQTRRRKCNIRHLEPLGEVLKIKKNASHDEVVKELKKFKIEVTEKKGKKKKTEKPVKQRKRKEAAEKGPAESKEIKSAKPEKKEAAKESKKEALKEKRKEAKKEKKTGKKK